MSTQVLVSPPKSLTFRTMRNQVFNWSLTDINGQPVVSAEVTSTMFVDRSLRTPLTQPGTPVTGFTDLVMSETDPGVSGIYSVIIDSSFNPPIADVGYVVVITAIGSDTAPIGQWDVPAVIIPPETDIDLVRLDQVKDWLGIPPTNEDCDGVIQGLISGFSQWVLNRTGIDSFNQVKNYIETYDGTGSDRLFLRNSPIRALNSLQIGARVVPTSTGVTIPGIYIEQERRSIAFRSAGYGWMTPSLIFPYRFIPGRGNIIVNYDAGYTSTPFDLAECCMKAVAINYKRKDWIDLASKQLSVQGQAAGATRYRDWALPPEVLEVIEFYSRYAHS